MIYNTWRKCFQIKVTYSIRAHKHCTLLFIKLVYNLLKHIAIAVKVVAVELYGKSTTKMTIYRIIPTSTYSKVGTFGYKMAHSVITTCTVAHSFTKRRTSKAALYAAMLPVTPNTIFFPCICILIRSKYYFLKPRSFIRVSTCFVLRAKSPFIIHA